jgi:hypothetical protein
MTTRKQFYEKHAASSRAIMDAAFAATSILADLRTQAETAAGECNKEMAQVARHLDRCCADVVSLVAHLPLEIMIAIYGDDERVSIKHATTTEGTPA